jgi:hypothetical protein
MGTMNVVAVITWFSAAVGGLFLLAARLTGYTSDFQGAAATRLPAPVIFAGPPPPGPRQPSVAWAR